MQSQRVGEWSIEGHFFSFFKKESYTLFFNKKLSEQSRGEHSNPSEYLARFLSHLPTLSRNTNSIVLAHFGQTVALIVLEVTKRLAINRTVKYRGEQHRNHGISPLDSFVMWMLHLRVNEKRRALGLCLSPHCYRPGSLHPTRCSFISSYRSLRQKGPPSSVITSTLNSIWKLTGSPYSWQSSRVTWAYHGLPVTAHATAFYTSYSFKSSSVQSALQ